MARAIWTGSVSFGLVNIPVGLFSAVSERTIRFNQLEAGTSDRIRYKRVNERTGKEVEYADIVKGYDVGGGRYVVVTEDELETVEPSGPRTIEIEDFVKADEIDPIFYNQTYYLAPRSEAAAHPYLLLVEAMRRTGMVGIATFVMRSREHMAALRPDENVLALETMYFADEIRDPNRELDLPSPEGRAKPRELETACSLVSSMATKWDPVSYHDRYRARVEELIEQKLAGQEVVASAERPEETNVVDLMEALRRSVSNTRDERSRTKRSAAKKTSTTERVSPKKSRATVKKAREPQGEQLSMMSKEELYQMAQEVDVPGRSKMTRRQLENALSKRAS